MADSSWLDAAQASELGGVRLQTLYAYVSRGKIRSKPDGADPRRSLYHRDDVRRLAARQRGQPKAITIAGESLAWGQPVLPSAISTVQAGRLWYRGVDAVTLAQAHQLEDVAALLWETDGVRPDLRKVAATAGPRRPVSGAIDAAVVAMARRSVVDLPSRGRTVAALRLEAGEVLARLVAALFGTRVLRAGGSISEQIASAWSCPRAEPLIRQALCLLADHELNASTFATRVAISTGASLSAGMLSGLATLTGPLHGRASLGLTGLVDAMRDSDVEAVVRQRLQAGQGFPAFGHPLYRDGDPRATALLGALAMPKPYRELARQVERLVGERPNIDFGLAVLTSVHELPAQAPLALFATGRCVGWLAHALEQAQTGQLIRPRANYVGIAPPLASPAQPRGQVVRPMAVKPGYRRSGR